MKIKKSQLSAIIDKFLNENITAATGAGASVMQALVKKSAQDFVRSVQDSARSRAVTSLPVLLKLSRSGEATLSDPGGSPVQAITASSGEAGVKELQRCLFSLRYNVGGGGPAKNGIDGQFGPSTKSALKKFRQDKDLPSDLPADQVGPVTAAALLAAIKKLGAVAAADDARPPKRPAVTRKEDVPLEKVPGLEAKAEPYAVDPEISPAEEPWTSSPKQKTITRNWAQGVHPETKDFLEAIPAALASLGLVDKKTPEGEAEAKEMAARLVNSVYRDALKQTVAMYEFPYKYDLAARHFGAELELDPLPAAGDYFYTGGGKSDELIASINTAVQKGFPNFNATRKPHGTFGVYVKGGYASRVFKAFEAATGGKYTNYSSAKDAAIKAGLPIVTDHYEKEPSGHVTGKSIDMSIEVVPGKKDGLAKVIPRIEQISGVDFKFDPGEGDHFHMDLAESSIYRALYGEED